MEKQKRTKLKNEGITLIALVITIIVLLILAGVSIAMLTGDNGILTQAQNSQRETERAKVIEEVQTEVMGKQAEEGTANLDRTDLKGILDKYFESVPDDFTKDTELQTLDEYGDYQIKVSEVYAGELLEEPILAGDVLIPNASGGTAEEISPYVMYNNILCRVLYNDETHGLQIVSADNVEDVTLGYGDPTVTADDFTYDGKATVDDDFKKTAASYNNAVDTLNKKAEDHMETKAIDARSLGGIATLGTDGKFQGDTSGMFTGTRTYLETYGWNGKFKDGDTNYEEDVNQINTLGLNATEYTWLASRTVSDPSYTLFNVLVLDTYGRTHEYYLCRVGDYGIKEDDSGTYGFRPVFLLSSDVAISRGDGSKDNPYVIE